REFLAVGARCLHRSGRDADQRLLREPPRRRHGVESVGVDGERVRRARSCDRRGEVDRHRGGPRLRCQLTAPRDRRGLRLRRREQAVRARLRRGMGQGDEPRPLRPSSLTFVTSSPRSFLAWGIVLYRTILRVLALQEGGIMGPTETVERLGQFLAAGDAQGALALYETDATFVVEPGALAVGHTAIGAALAQF